MSVLDRSGGRAGFTLVEMAIVLVISGLGMLMIAALAKNHYEQTSEQRTVENLRISEAALVQFVGNLGRYPCPADPTLPPDDPNYGLERCRSPVLPDCSGALPPGQACANIGSRDADGNGQPDVVMIGMLPVRTIYNAVNQHVKFRENQGLDGYGNRLTYAVTESMTSTGNTPFNPVNYGLGAIRVQDENSVRLTAMPTDSAHFVLVSHGKNGEGAYSQSGAEIPDCTVLILGVPSPAPPGEFGGVNPEKENCDRNDAIFVDALRGLDWGNNNYFDDIVVFRAGGFQPLWVQSLNSPLGTVWINNTNLGNVAVGPGFTDPEQALHVVGDLSAQGGVMAQGYCGASGPDPGGNPAADDCMFAESIGGDRASMECANPMEAAYAIEDNKVLCRQVFVAPPPPAKVCPPGEFLTGISNKGNIRCAPL